MTVIDYAVVRDAGSIVVFDGTDADTGERVTFGVDHRMAQALLDPDCDIDALHVEAWQTLGRAA